MTRFDHFSILAPVYDRVIGINQSTRLIQLAALPTQGILLDVGGGTGRIGSILQPYARSVIISDISVGMLKQAVRKGNLSTTCSPAEKLPFPNDHFDRIVMVDALHHVYNAKKTCDELWRVIKPGGRIVIEEPDIRTFPVKMVAIVEKLAMMRSHFISPPDIIDFFEKSIANKELHQDGYTSWVVIEKPI